MAEQPALAELISTITVFLEHKEDEKLEKGDVTYYLMLGTKIAYEAMKKQIEINELEATV